MFCKKCLQETIFSLKDEEILNRLDTTEDEKVINEIHKTCFEVLYKDLERADLIDSKGSSLIAMIGLSFSLTFSLGGILIEKIRNIAIPYVGCPVSWFVFLYISSSITLLVAIGYALQSVKTRSDWRWLKDEDIFRDDRLKAGITKYKIYMSNHAWQIYRNNYNINETKAKRLKQAQWIFFMALIQIMIIILLISIYTISGGYLNI
jgi:hypothetical protein